MQFFRLASFLHSIVSLNLLNQICLVAVMPLKRVEEHGVNIKFFGILIQLMIKGDNTAIFTRSYGQVKCIKRFQRQGELGNPVVCKTIVIGRHRQRTEIFPFEMGHEFCRYFSGRFCINFLICLFIVIKCTPIFKSLHFYLKPLGPL